MVKRSKFFWINPTRLKSVFKILLAFLVFWLVWRAGFSWPAVFGFFIFWLLLYFSYPERKKFAVSFWLTGLSFIGGFKILFRAVDLGIKTQFMLLFFLIAALLISLLLGLMSFWFKNPRAIYVFFQFFLLLIIFLIFSLEIKLPQIFPLLFLLFLALLFLFRETFLFFGFDFQHRFWVMSAAAALVITEIAWLASFLALNPIRLAIFLTVLAFVLREMILAHFSGGLTPSFIFSQILILLIFILIIFLTNRWLPNVLS